jgi:tripartite-type tricarboxylate transporter receptor subunit TctC
MMRESAAHFFCSRRNFLKSITVGALAINVAGRIPYAFAKDLFPVEKIAWVSPYKVGGGFDIVARGIGPYLTKYLRELSPGAKGGDILVKDETAAGGQRAYGMVYNARPDGYTVGAFDMAFAADTLMSKLPFDLNKFTYLVRMMTTTRVLVTHKNGFADWAEMIKSSKTKELKWGVGAIGRGLTLDSIIVKEAVGIPARFIPWGGTAQCMNALMRGDVQVALVSEDSVKALLSSGEIKPLTQFTEVSEYRGVPSIKDLGYPDLVEKVGTQRFVIAPPALNKEAGELWIAAFKKALGDKDFQAWTKKMDIPLNPIYGKEADTLAKKMLVYYQQELKPLLLKYQ